MLLAYVISDIGLVRENNEDNYVFVPPYLFIVADGMGGHVAGEVASNLVTNMVSDFMNENIGRASPEILLQQAICQANQHIYRLSVEKSEYYGMGTTITATYVDGGDIYWAHVGDSRLYVVENETMRQLTTDHSLVWELVNSGSITPGEAHTHPQRNLLTRAVGTTLDLTVDTGVTKWSAHDQLMLCTDGLTNMVSEEAIRKILCSGKGDMILQQLVGQAKQAGGLDNITIILLRHEE